MSETTGSLLLDSLPRSDRLLVLHSLKLVALRVKEVLIERDAPIEHVDFPVSGMVSLVSTLSSGRPIEMASVGREGMVGMPLFFRTDTLPERAVVQLPGRALRMSARQFREVLQLSPGLNDALLRYAGCLYSFAAQNTACGSKHQMVPRLARWLLHAADQSGTESLRLTHEYASVMLGVRRSSITVAAGALRKKNVISYTRSTIDITDRDGLVENACECYSTVSRTYSKVLGSATASAGLDPRLTALG